MTDITDFGFDASLNKPAQNTSTSLVYDTQDLIDTGRIASGGNLNLKSLSIAGLTKSVSPGDDLQAVINALTTLGGGNLQLAEGTYLLKAPLNITTPVRIQGANFATTIIDCGNTVANIVAQGLNEYTTGTLAVNDSSTSVAGSGTTWTSSMVGRSILLLGNWYPIVNVGSTTSLTLAFPYSGNNLSGYSYVIANPLDGVAIDNIQVLNSTATTGGIYVKNALRTDISNYVIEACTVGLELNGVQNFNVVEGNCIANGVNYKINNIGSATLNNFLSINSTSDGIQVSNTANFEISDYSVINSGGNGIKLTSCSNMGIIDGSIDANTGHGIELVSGCTGIQIIVGTITNNGGDGVKLTATSDRNSIGPIILENNTGYGINIADATCDDNTIIVPSFIGNTAGTYQDLGTNTNVVATVTKADAQTFTSNGTWTKPTSAKMVVVTCVGAGGGGGGGDTGIGASAGGAGAITTKTFLASDLSSTLAITVGTAGSGGTAGTDGSTGGNSSFGTYLFAYGGGKGKFGLSASGGGGGGDGGAGQDGQSAANSLGGVPAVTAGAVGLNGQGAGGVNIANGQPAEYGGGSGAGRASNGGDSLFGAAGGGGGGNGASGGNGGGVGKYTSGNGGAGGTSGTTGNNGTPGANGGSLMCGAGGGGGGTGTAGDGGNGGAGGTPGGGGGGAGKGTTNGGLGGAGGRGEVRIYSV